MKRHLNNAARLLRSPSMIAAYLQWTGARLRGRSPTVSVGRFKIGQFENFSHYWARRVPIHTSTLRLFAAIKAAVPPNSIAIDVGANLGITALALAEAGFEVVALEPSAETFRRLQLNLVQCL